MQPSLQPRQVAKEAIRRFGTLSYDRAEWERLIANPRFEPAGCFLDILGFDIDESDREHIMTAVAAGLRRRFPEFSRGAKRWRDKEWTDEVIEAVLQAVIDEIEQSIAEPRLTVAFPILPSVQPELAPQESGFVPWRLFRHRAPVSSSPGLYILAHSLDAPEAKVDPLSEHVIYIGIAEDQSTGSRLLQFERSALGKTGHSAGWTLRMELLQEYFANDVTLLRAFHNIYCSWKDVLGSSPRDQERELIQKYQVKWGHRPILNRKD